VDALNASPALPKTLVGIDNLDAECAIRCHLIFDDKIAMELLGREFITLENLSEIQRSSSWRKGGGILKETPADRFSFRESSQPTNMSLVQDISRKTRNGRGFDGVVRMFWV